MSKKIRLGVLGNPIEHSLSPFIHSRFARQHNINIDYQAYKVEEDKFESFIAEFFSDKTSKGLNVTLPLKSLAAKIKGEISEEAKFINAVNTVTKNNKNFFEDKIETAKFFFDRILPRIDAYYKSGISGSKNIMNFKFN